MAKKQEKKKFPYSAKDMNEHAFAYIEVNRIMAAQGQPVNIIQADKKGFTIQLRVNLNNVQAERLIVKPCAENIADYTAVADLKNKTLRIFTNAPVQSRKTVSIGNPGQAEG